MPMNHLKANPSTPGIDFPSGGVAKLGMVLPPLVIGLLLTFFALTPVADDQPLPLWRLTYAHWLHHIGFGLLFLFLICAQYLQIEAKLHMARNHSMIQVTRAYYRLWLITELLPAPAALLLCLTGFRLIRETGASLTSNWVFWLVTFFGLLFWDGIFYFTNDTRRMKNAAVAALQQGMTASEFAAESRNFTRDTLLFLHFASFPFIFQIGALRPDCWAPLQPQMKILDALFLKHVPGGWDPSWAHVATAVAVFFIMLPIVLGIRFAVSILTRILKPLSRTETQVSR
jgi:hypothetical protein